MKFAFNYIWYELNQAFINEKKVLNYVIVYVLFIIIFALALKQSSLILSEHVAIIIWLTLLTNIIIVSTTLFQDNQQKRVFKMFFLINNKPFSLLVFYKCVSYWIQLLVALLLLLPLIQLLVPGITLSKYALAFSLSVPSLTTLAILCSALANSSTNKGGLLSLLFLPLSLPITLFSISLTQLNLPLGALIYTPECKILLAFLLFSSFLGPYALSKILKQDFLYNS